LLILVENPGKAGIFCVYSGAEKIRSIVRNRNYTKLGRTCDPEGGLNLLSPQPQKHLETSGRFEIERNGEVAYLEYSLSPGVLELIHTEVPRDLRHMGLATLLAETALQYARENNLKVDIICPTVREYIDKHPEYSGLVMH